MENTNSSPKKDTIKQAKFIGPEMVMYKTGTVYPVLEEKHGMFLVDNLRGSDYYLPKKWLEFIEN